jgi:RNA polymerase subunit RPABC4/transcription elongation factor Spt4
VHTPAEDSEFLLALSYNIGNRLGGVAMPYCQHCKKSVDEDLVFCPECGEVLVEEDEEDIEWQNLELQRDVEEAKDRANMYVILTIVLVTLGMIGSSVLFVLSSVLGLFGIAFVCLGIGSAAAADRYARRAGSLKNQLSRCD